MRILVCVKQVPDTLEPTISPKTLTLSRDSMQAVMNPFDLYALEAAARWKDAVPETKITALSMGPARAASVLRDALALTADDAYLVCDDELAGADLTLSARALEAAIRKLEAESGPFDLIFTGAKSSDGGTSALGPLLAGRLGFVAFPWTIMARQEKEGGLLLQETEYGRREIRFHMPALLTFTKAAYQIRYPMIARILLAERAAIPVFTAADLPGFDLEESQRLHMLAAKHHKPQRRAFVIPGDNPRLAAEKLGKELEGII